MTERVPIKVTNLDRYGNAVLPWSRPHDLLENFPKEAHKTYFLGTSQAGKPHSAGVGALWHDGDFYLVSGPKTRKSRNLAANPACTISVSLEGMDLIFEGEAKRVTDKPTLEKLAQLYRDSGWPAEVEDDAFTAPFSAPSAGPPPWYLYRFSFHTVFGVATVEPHGATRWRFSP